MASAWAYDSSRGLQYRYDGFNDEYVYEDGSRVARQPPANISHQTSSPYYSRFIPNSGVWSPTAPDLRHDYSLGHGYPSRTIQQLDKPVALSTAPFYTAQLSSGYNVGSITDKTSFGAMAQAMQRENMEVSQEQHSTALSNVEANQYQRKFDAQSSVQGKHPAEWPQMGVQQSSASQQALSESQQRSLTQQPPPTQVGSPASGQYSLLESDFKTRSQPRKFFTVGKVFLTLWNEAAHVSSKSVMSGPYWCQNNYGEWIYTKVRRFIVVREDEFACLAVPVTTYNGQGVAKKGVKRSDHCIVYSGRAVPPFGHGEAPSRIDEAQMQPFPIQVDSDQGEKLDPMSRINFAKPQTIEHYVKVKSVGKVSQSSMNNFLYQFRNVIGNVNST